MACRSTEKAQAAKEEIIEQLKGQPDLGEIVVKCLDLTSCKSIRECAQEILDEEPRIDILLNNAGKITNQDVVIKYPIMNFLIR